MNWKELDKKPQSQRPDHTLGTGKSTALSVALEMAVMCLAVHTASFLDTQLSSIFAIEGETRPSIKEWTNYNIFNNDAVTPLWLETT